MADEVSILLILRDFASGIAQLRATAAAERDIGVAAKEASAGQAAFHRRSFLTNQVLFTMRRYLYQATLGLTALAGAAVYTGFKFDSMQQRTTIALGYLLKNTALAGQEFKELMRIARETSFSPTGVIQAGQQLIAFGFDAQTTNRALRDMGDAIAALNLPQETINRIILALGQIRVKGRVMGEELRQLANANIPAYTYLAKAFNLNAKQLNKIGDAGIPAAQGIEAILRGLEGQYGGATKAIRNTTSFQFEQLKGDLQVIFGAIVSGAFGKLAGAMKSITDVTGKMFDAVINGNAGFMDLVDILDRSTGGSYHLRAAFELVGDALHQLWISATIVLAAFKPLLITMAAFAYVTIKSITAVSRFFNKVNELQYMGIAPLTDALEFLSFILGLVGIVYILTGIRAAFLTVKTQLLAFWIAYTAIEEWILTRATLAWRAAMLAAATAEAIVTLGLIAMGGWVLLIIAAIVATIGVLFVLERRFHAVSRSVIYLWEKLKAFYNWLKGHRLGSALLNIIPGVGPALALTSSIAGFFQHGGTAGKAGRYVVGESGPEVVNLPTGARVTPVASRPMDWSGMAAAGTGGMNITIVPADVNIDGRKIAEVVFKHRADRIARR